MRQISILILFPILLFACSDKIENPYNLKLLSVRDIIREYAIADSLNKLDDRNNIDTEPVILGIDERNGKQLIRTCINRGFGCLLFSDYYTILYQDCDSSCCEKSGNLLIDYAGIVGARTIVGCEPDTTKNNSN